VSPVKALVVYDSLYGNTENIAKAIGDAISGEVDVLRVGVVNSSELNPCDLLIVGSPTHGGRPTSALQDFLKEIPESAVHNVKGAAFDTRFSSRLVRIFGYAAEKIATILKKKGGNLILSPEGVFVKDKEGPLKEGELERAARWVTQ
jgi:flavodoxin